MEYNVLVYYWKFHKKECISMEFKFDNQLDALKFANDVSDHFWGLEQIDVSVNWRIKEK